MHFFKLSRTDFVKLEPETSAYIKEIGLKKLKLICELLKMKSSLLFDKYLKKIEYALLKQE